MIAMDENKTVQHPCSSCMHNNVCRFADDMERLALKVADAYIHTEKVEAFVNHINISCRQFYQKSTPRL